MVFLAYIDPGTGSMLFTILVSVIGAAAYALRNLFMKLQFVVSAGKIDEANRNRLPLVIYSDSTRYWNMFGPICEELEKRGQETAYMTSSPDDPALESTFKHIHCSFIGEGNRAYAKLNALSADVLLTTTPGLDVYQWKRSKGVKEYVHIIHMCSDPVIYRMFGTDYFDVLLLSGEYQIGQIRELEKLRDLPAKEIELVGVPYMDALKAKLEAAPPLPPHPRTVLLAPSWGPSGIFTQYGEAIFEALQKTGYRVIVRPHPQSLVSEKPLLEKLKGAYPDSDWMEWDFANDNFETLRRADILISDFSGVIFDFALVFDKPIIYADTSFDKGVYDACWLKEELWTFTTLPKIGRRLTRKGLPSIKSLIDTCLDEPAFQQARAQARKETWAHVGQSVPRTVDYLAGLLSKTKEISPDRKQSRFKTK